MSHASKAKAKGISASSFFDLKAELSKKEEEFARNKAAGSSAIVGGVKRPDKKPTVWARQNKGVSSRAARDHELEEISRPTLESARAALERKALIYEKLRKGKTGGLSDKQYDALLVDFDSKPMSGSYESDSDDVDESLSIPRPPTNDESDPVMEYEDEFGRIRTARQSEIPRGLLPRPEDNEPDEDEDIVIRNPVNHFPVYELSAERVAEVAKAYAEENNPLEMHYDASREVRAKGAGFYQFSGDEETRQAQMEELKSARRETERTRHESGAVDTRPGEIEGMRDIEGGSGSTKSRAMEKRKRELEQRRKVLDAKRRKLKGPEPVNATSSEAASFFASAGDSQVPEPVVQPPPKPAIDDPFAALEAEAAPAQPKLKDKGKGKSAPVVNDADTFLSNLEQQFLSSKTKKTR